MKKLFLVLCVCALLTGCGETVTEQAAVDPAAVEEAYKTAMSAMDQAQTDQEKAEIVRTFLETWPVTDKSIRALDALRYFQGNRLGDMAGVIQIAETARAKVTDASLGRDIDFKLARMYADAGLSEQFSALAPKLATSGPMTFNLHLDLARQATQLSQWDIALDNCSRAEQFASAEAFRADYPDETFTDERVESAGKNRQALLLTYASWARAHLGEVDEALAGYARADELTTRNRIMQPAADTLDYYWGRSLMMAGQYEEAFNHLLVSCIDIGNGDSWDALKEAYIGMGKPEDDFKTFAWAQITGLNLVPDEFNLPDRDGAMHTLSELAGKVTLVAFWHPT